MVPEQLGETCELAHACNAFCREGLHAQLLYGQNCDLDGARAMAREFCRQSGFRFIAVAEAREAGPMPDDWPAFSPTLGGVVRDIEVARGFPILLFYEDSAD